MARLRPAEVAIASTDAGWATALTEWLTDHDDALRLRDHYLTTEADLRGQRYDALVIDAAHSLLTAYTVQWVTGGGRALVVVAEGDDDRVRLGNLGVEHVIDAAADPARVAALIAQVVATRREFAAVLRPSEDRPAARPPGGITTVVTGVGEPAGAVEVAVQVGVELRRRGGAVTLIDADTAYPQLAQRLCLDGAPGLLDAVDAVTHGHARPADALQVVARLGVHALVGLESPRHWQRLGAADTAATVEALRVMAHHLVILADAACQASGEGRNDVARALLGAADRVIVVAAMSPAGIKTVTDWAVDARELCDLRRVTVVAHRRLRRAGASEWRHELLRTVRCGDARVWPDDPKVVEAAWRGEAVRAGPWTRSVAGLVGDHLPEPERQRAPEAVAATGTRP